MLIKGRQQQKLLRKEVSETVTKKQRGFKVQEQCEKKGIIGSKRQIEVNTGASKKARKKV